LILARVELSRRIRRHVGHELYDDSLQSATSGSGIAIYGLSDPRELRCVRYVGQTLSPRHRFLQHLNAARLWLADERPWWIGDPKLRPLYEWIRALYQQDGCLPTMVVSSWAESRASARLAERARICECLAGQLPLLNVEAQRQAGQYQLL
jgi:hypothetical protein